MRRVVGVSSAVAALRKDVRKTGYYPDLVLDSLDTALAGESVRAHLVHHEAHFDGDELRRHVTVLLLTPSRLVIGHTDEYPPDESHPSPYALSSTEAVSLARISSVVVTRTIGMPTAYKAGDPSHEVLLSIGWGAVSRVEIELATCGDPQCEADHGYSGTIAADDFALRMSQAGDGPGGPDQALAFASALSAATGVATR
jgi:hypothetical protein